MNDREVGLTGNRVDDRARDGALVLVEDGDGIFAARSGATAVNFRQRESGRGDDSDWRDQQHEQTDAIAPDEPEFLADRQPHREQHHRLMGYRAARGR